MRLHALAFLLLAACSAAPSEPGPGDAPSAPGKSDGAEFQVTGAKGWYLVGNELTPGDRLQLEIAGPEDTGVIDLWIDGTFVERARAADGNATFDVDLKDLPVGAHTALLAADGARYAFAAVEFQRSHPLYVTVTNDWDQPDNNDAMLERQERLHAAHPHLVLTHFVGPYTFTDPAVSPARREYLARWVANLRDTEGDEIGLHVHPWCTFVRAAGVTCRSAPSFAYANGDTSGYTVILSSYTDAELVKLMGKARELFEANGLGTPTSFRAGGWTAELNVLRGIASAGHVADSSGCNWARLEEWQHHSGAALYPWNREHWAPIDELSQPYYPAEDDILADREPHMSVLEVPDNGALVDYVSGAEMIDMFEKNWPQRAALEAPVNYTIGYHPPNFSEAYLDRMNVALSEIDKHLAVDGTGPVVYARISDLPKVYSR